MTVGIPMKHWHFDKLSAPDERSSRVTMLSVSKEILGRRFFAILFACVLGAALGGVVKYLVGNTYASHVIILPQFTESQRGPQATVVSNSAQVDGGSVVESHLQILQSYDLARKVVDRLGLGQEPDTRFSAFVNRSKRTISDFVERYIAPKLPGGDGSTEALAQISRSELATRRLLQNLKMSRHKGSYTIEVEYVDRTPEGAASVLNALASEYIRMMRRQRLAGLHRNVLERLNDQSRMYGPHHPLILALSGELKGLAKGLRAEETATGVLAPDELVASGLVIPALAEALPVNGGLSVHILAGLLTGLIGSIMLLLFCNRDRLLNQLNVGKLD